MIVEIDDTSGFCFGVVRAITKAQEALSGHRKVYSLGDIVHNRIEMKRLERLGLRTVVHSQLPQLEGETVLIRAHGEPPETYVQAEKSGIRLIDATCPVVAKLQEKIKTAYEKMAPVNGQVVILGKHGHAEVAGLTGQIGGKAIVIENIEDLPLVDFNRPIYFLSQTTQSLSLFEEIKGIMLERTAQPEQLIVEDTICRQVSNRNPHLRKFASEYDVVLFVSGKESSNGKFLYQTCKEVNPQSYQIEDEHDIVWSWFDKNGSVGICGATSTPKWLMKKIARVVADRFE